MMNRTFLALALSATAGLVACGGGTKPNAASGTTALSTAPPSTAGSATTNPAPTTSTTRVATATSTTTTAPERLTDQSRVRLDGIGPITVGMTQADASRAAGANLALTGTDIGTDCRYAHADGTGAGLDFMIVHGSVARVDVRAPSTVATLSGVQVGDTEDRVKAAYPGRIEVTAHPYVTTGHYLVYHPADASQQAFGLIFETDGQRVTSFRSGLASAVSAIEGCA